MTNVRWIDTGVPGYKTSQNTTGDQWLPEPRVDGGVRTEPLRDLLPRSSRTYHKNVLRMILLCQGDVNNAFQPRHKTNEK